MNISMPRFGDWAKRLADRLGVPDTVGDLVALNVDFATGNLDAAVERVKDLFDARKEELAPSGEPTATSPEVSRWRTFLAENGWDAFMREVDAGHVPDEVLEDASFALTVQDAQSKHARLLQLLSNLQMSEHQLAMGLIHNLRA